MKNHSMKKSNKALLIGYGCAIVLVFALVVSLKATVQTYYPTSAHIEMIKGVE